MNSRQRINTAMRHEVPDRVPVMCQLALGHYFLHSHARPSDIWFDSQTLITTLAELQKRYRFDGLLINLPGRPANWKDYLASYHSTEGSEELVWQCGMETWIPRDDNAHTFVPRRQPLPRVDYNSVDPCNPAIFHTPGYVWNTWHAPTLWDIPIEADLADPASYPPWMTRGLRVARQTCPEISVHQEVFSPFTHLLELFGYEQALMALVDAPELCHKLLATLTQHVVAQVQCYGPCEADAILISSAFAGAGFISRDMYREFVMPYEKQVAHAIKTFGIASYTHTCGAIGDRLDLMAQTDVDGIDTLDPPPLGSVDLAEAKTQFGKRFFFKGNLDAVSEMLNASDAVFNRAVKQRLDIGKPGGGYILSSACSVAPHVKPQRLIRMVELAEECGRYE